MGLFSRGRDYDMERKKALLELDREKSISVIIQFTKQLDALQSFANQRKHEETLWMAQKCSQNPIISCSNNELPAVGLQVVQEMILDAVVRLDPAFLRDQEQGLYNIAMDGECSYIVDVCRQAMQQLRNVR